MSAKLTVLFFILICFEIGVLLVILPWIDYPPWTENFLLIAAVDRLQSPWLASVVRSGYLKGAVTGLGLLNLLIGVWEVINFRKTVRTFQTELQNREAGHELLDPVGLRDHRSTTTPGSDE
jgi:hypothetical protein